MIGDALGAVEHAAERFIHPAQPSAPTFTRNPSSQPYQQEQRVTTPQQQRVVDSLHAITGEIQSNSLIGALVEQRLGALLSPGEISTVLTFVSGLERPRRQPQQGDPKQANG